MGSKLHVLFFTFLLMAVFYSFVMFVDDADSIAKNRNNIKKVDVIVVLTGGDGRIDTAVDLYENRFGSTLVLSGVHKNATLTSILGSKYNTISTSNILIDRKSKNTFENAVETKKLLANHRVKSIMIVTSKYHMVRSKYLFLKHGTSGVEYQYYSVDGGDGIAGKFLEFVKYYYYYLGDNLKSTVKMFSS